MNLVHANQYGFLKTRSIQDCLAWAYEFIRQCHQSKQQIVVLKLDFGKSFDLLEHHTIKQLLIARALGLDGSDGLR